MFAFFVLCFLVLEARMPPMCQRRLMLCVIFRRAVLRGPTGENSGSWNVAIIQLQSGQVTYTTGFPFLSVRSAVYATTFLQLLQYARSGSLIAVAPQENNLPTVAGSGSQYHS
jgi:hypothetical protein